VRAATKFGVLLIPVSLADADELPGGVGAEGEAGYSRRETLQRPLSLLLLSLASLFLVVQACRRETKQPVETTRGQARPRALFRALRLHRLVNISLCYSAVALLASNILLMQQPAHGRRSRPQAGTHVGGSVAVLN
jgi:hypothetical protein